jgi:hypothetical protein
MTYPPGATIVSRAELARVPRWARAFADQRKDHRYYEIVEDTIRGFDCRYIVVADAGGTVRAGGGTCRTRCASSSGAKTAGSSRSPCA